jgi:hypothetical protein
MGYMLMKTIEELLSTLGAEVTTGVTSGVGTAHPSRAPEFTPIFNGVHVAHSLIIWSVYYIEQVEHRSFNYKRLYKSITKLALVI